MSSYGNINQSRYNRAMTPKRLQNEDPSAEIHITEKECRYEEIPGYWRVISTGEHVLVFVRICYCKKHDNKEEFLSRKEIYGHEITNGVEVHWDIGCRYIVKRLPNGFSRIEKLCKCPK